jgi:hypothetical protein
MLTFLKAGYLSLENYEQMSPAKPIRPAVQHNTKQHARSPAPKTQAFYASDQLTNECLLCQQTHYIYQCSSFLKRTPDNRYTNLKKLKVCHRCLGSDQAYNDCKSDYLDESGLFTAEKQFFTKKNLQRVFLHSDVSFSGW